MKNITNKILIMALLILSATFVVTSLSAASQKESLKSLMSDSYFTLQDDTWQKLMEEPALKFQKALDSFLKNDMQEAALNIRQAATIVNVEVTRSEKEMQQKLQTVAAELVALSKDVKRGKVMNTSQLEKSFFKTEKILAIHKFKKAKGYLHGGFFQNTAYALEATARHALYSQLWTEKKLSESNLTKLRQIREGMFSMIETETYAKKKMEANQQALGILLTEL